MRRLMAKVEEMREQRNTLEEQLRKEVREDDITNAIVTQEGVNKQVHTHRITVYPGRGQ